MQKKKKMSKRIMIAEDDQFLANAYRVKLEKENFEVSVVDQGQELLDKVKDFKPHLILLDLVMPIMDGFEALKTLKANKDTKNIPVLITSNLGQQTDLDKSMKLGAKDYIIKSNVSLKDIVKKVKKLTTQNG